MCITRKKRKKEKRKGTEIRKLEREKCQTIWLSWWRYRWISAWLQQLQCVSNGVTAAPHRAINAMVTGMITVLQVYFIIMYIIMNQYQIWINIRYDFKCQQLSNCDVIDMRATSYCDVTLIYHSDTVSMDAFIITIALPARAFQYGGTSSWSSRDLSLYIASFSW